MGTVCTTEAGTKEGGATSGGVKKRVTQKQQMASLQHTLDQMMAKVQSMETATATSQMGPPPSPLPPRYLGPTGPTPSQFAPPPFPMPPPSQLPVPMSLVAMPAGM